jgi:hypothetical protein
VYPPKAEVETMTTVSKRMERMDFIVNSLLFEHLSLHKTNWYIDHHKLGHELTMVTYALPEKQVRLSVPSFLYALRFISQSSDRYTVTGTRYTYPTILRLVLWIS